MSELALGTVQFGLNYGITNTQGEISDSVMIQMLDLASSREIKIFDTAADYGNSQSRLGEYSYKDPQRVYVTKFSLPQDGSASTAHSIYRSSMQDLKVSQLHGVLFHKLENLLDPRCEETVSILREGRASQEIKRIGVSIYNSQDLELALNVFPDLDIIQLPANILDLNLLESEQLRSLKSKGVEIHVRSVFLQGLLLSDPDELPSFFENLKPALLTLRQHSIETGNSVLELVLGNMRAHPLIDVILVGATSVNELEEISSAWISSSSIERFELPVVPHELLDPRNWPQIRMNS